MEPGVLLALMSTLFAIQCGYMTSSLFTSKQQEWRKLILTHHWPVTVCKMDGVHCENPPKYWTLHGLWPDKTQMCNNSWHFDYAEIQVWHTLSFIPLNTI
ncbi:ribonuclease T2-like [Discoglossus pictus]